MDSLGYLLASDSLKGTEVFVLYDNGNNEILDVYENYETALEVMEYISEKEECPNYDIFSKIIK